MTEPELHIHTDREKRPVSGMDTVIAAMPEQFYIDVRGERSLALTQFGRWLRKLAEKMATDIGEELHHADFVITTEPSVVQSRGSMHDCDTCRAGVRRALRALRENPNQELLVGLLYWAGPVPARSGEAL
jgi:hypothetical protein